MSALEKEFFEAIRDGNTDQAFSLFDLDSTNDKQLILIFCIKAYRFSINQKQRKKLLDFFKQYVFQEENKEALLSLGAMLQKEEHAISNIDFEESIKKQLKKINPTWNESWVRESDLTISRLKKAEPENITCLQEILLAMGSCKQDRFNIFKKRYFELGGGELNKQYLKINWNRCENSTQVSNEELKNNLSQLFIVLNQEELNTWIGKKFPIETKEEWKLQQHKKARNLIIDVLEKRKVQNIPWIRLSQSVIFLQDVDLALKLLKILKNAQRDEKENQALSFLITHMRMDQNTIKNADWDSVITSSPVNKQTAITSG